MNDTPNNEQPSYAMLAKMRDRAKIAENQLAAMTAQRDRLVKLLEPFTYWRDISECDCSNPLPHGGCLRCDLDRVLQIKK